MLAYLGISWHLYNNVEDVCVFFLSLPILKKITVFQVALEMDLTSGLKAPSASLSMPATHEALCIAPAPPCGYGLFVPWLI
jgi:hypothetical protein